MGLYLGIDTSNYTTSLALYNSDSESVVQVKKLLPVKSGEKGIRQSDAVFHHTQQLRELFLKLLREADLTHLCIDAVGVSTSPRRAEGSYMPCFTVGMTAAEMVSRALGVPCKEFSHQEGHIAAALYSADKLSLIGGEFLAFHVSGGTTESLHVVPPIIAEVIGTSSDLKAGQAIDRVGLMLGLDFPCGPELERLAAKSTRVFKLKPSLSGTDLSLSGIENKAKKMLDSGESHEDIALFCLKSIEAGIIYLAENAHALYSELPIVFSGGVMSNKLIRNSLLERFDSYFAEPEFSSDNAVGVAILSSII